MGAAHNYRSGVLNMSDKFICTKCKTEMRPFNRIVDKIKARTYMIYKCPKCGNQLKVKDKKPIFPEGTVIPKKSRGNDLEKWAKGKGYLNRTIMICRKYSGRSKWIM